MGLGSEVVGMGADAVLGLGLERGLVMDEAVAAALGHLDRILGAMGGTHQADSEASARLHLAAGRVLERLGMDDAAQARFEAARRRWSGSVGALRKVRQQARRHAEYERVPGLIGDELALVSKADRRVALLLERAGLASGRGDVGGALVDALAAAQIVPNALGVMETLRGLYAAQGAWVEAVDVLAQMAEASSDVSLKVAWLMLAAGIAEHRLTQPQRAAELLGLVLKSVPDHAGALVGLERLLSASGQWELLWQVEVKCADYTQTRGATPAEVFGRYMYAAVIARERLQRPEAAIMCLEAAARLQPEDTRPLTFLSDLYTAQGGWNALEQTLKRLLALVTHPAWRARLMLQRAQNLHENLGQTNAAIEVVDALLAQQPAHPLALETLRRVLLADGRLKPLIERELIAAERTSPKPLQVERLIAVGRFCVQHEPWVDTAVETFRRALSLDIQHTEAFDQLQMVFRRRRDWPALGKLYSQVAEHAQGARRAALLWELVRLQSHELASPPDAVLTLRQLRRLCPEDLAVLWELQRHSQSLSRWDDLVESLLAEVPLTTEPTRRASLLCRVALVRWRQLTQPLAALEACDEALVSDPDHLPSHETRVLLLRSLEQWELLLQSLEVIERLTPSDAIPSLLCEMGDLWATRLGQTDRAVEVYERCLTRDPHYLPAYDALERLHRQAKRWADLREVMSRQTALDMPLSARTNAWVRIGLLMSERYDDLPQAEKALREALRCSPEDPLILQRLEGLLARMGEWTSQAALLDQHRANLKQPDRIAAVALRHGALLAWPLNQPNEAVHLLEYARRLQSSPELLLQLDVLNRRLSQPRALAQVLGEIAQSSGEAAISVAMGREIVCLLSDVHGEDVTGVLRAILQRDPNDRFALERLDALLGPSPERADLLPRLLRTAEQDEETELRLELAEHHLLTNQPQQAARLANEVLLRTPAHLVALRLGASASARTGEHGVACSLREREAEATPDIDQRIGALLRAADIANGQLNQPPRVRQLLFKALQLRPDHSQVFMLLVEHLRRHQVWDMLEQAMRLHIDAIDPDLRPPLLFELAKLRRDQLNKLPDATASLYALLDLQPLHLDALIALTQLEVRQLHWQEAVQAHKELLFAAEDRKTDPSRLREWRLELARILCDQLARPDEARSVLQDVLGSFPDDPQALRLYARLLEERGHLVEALDAYKRLLPQLSPLDATKISLRLVDLSRALEQPDQMREHLANSARQLLRESAPIPDILTAMLDWPRSRDDEQTLARLLQHFLQQAPSHPTLQSSLIPVRLTLASLLADRLDRRPEAEAEARKAAQAAPNNAAAQILTARLQSHPIETRRFALAAIAANPFSADAFSLLARSAEDSGNRDATGTFQQVLCALGAMDPAQAEWGRRVARSVQQPAITPDHDEWSQLLAHPEEVVWARELLYRAGFSAQIFKLPVPEAQPCPPDHPAVHQTRLVQKQLGLPALETWLAPTQLAPSIIHPEHEAVIVLGGSAMQNSTEASIRFHLGYSIASSLVGSTLMDILDDTDLVRILQGLIGMQYRETTEPELSKQLKGNFLSRKARSAVLDFLKVQDPRMLPFDLLGWRRAAASSSLKLAAVLSRDVSSSIQALMQRAGIRQPLSGSTPERIALLSRIPDVSTLLHFVVSDDYYTLRKRLNLITPAS